MSTRDLADLVADLEPSAWALAALSCAFKTNLAGQLKTKRSLEELVGTVDLPPQLIEPILDILVALKLVHRDGASFEASPALAPYLESPVKDFFESKLSAMHYQLDRLVGSVREGESPADGWSHTDLDYLRDIGILSATFAKVLAKEVFPKMEGVQERLSAPDATFLEVGTGVGALTLQICRQWPNLRVVGLEILPPSYEDAVENIEEADLEDRVEMRHQSVTELADVEAFDVAWLPLSFFRRELIEVAIRKVLTALRPGGWVVASTVSIPGTDLRSAITRLIGPLWGGHGVFSDEVERMLTQAGYQQVVQIPMAPGVQPIIVGRRAT